MSLQECQAAICCRGKAKAFSPPALALHCNQQVLSLPDASRSLTRTRNFSSATWASVIRNTVPTFFTPALMQRDARSLCGGKERETEDRRQCHVLYQTPVYKRFITTFGLFLSCLHQTGLVTNICYLLSCTCLNLAYETTHYSYTVYLIQLVKIKLIVTQILKESAQDMGSLAGM